MKEKKSKKRSLILAGIVVCAAVAVFLLMRGKKNAGDDVPTFTVAEGPLTIGVTSSGTIQSRDKEILKSELEGNNVVIWVIDEGVNVKAGDLLIQVDVGAIEAAGKSPATMVIITNSDAYSTIKASVGVVKAGEASCTYSK